MRGDDAVPDSGASRNDGDIARNDGGIALEQRYGRILSSAPTLPAAAAAGHISGGAALLPSEIGAVGGG